ncbi:MAG: HEAT repeat domain-containing protein [Planctomycetaceae bacterium]
MVRHSAAVAIFSLFVGCSSEDSSSENLTQGSEAVPAIAIGPAKDSVSVAKPLDPVAPDVETPSSGQRSGGSHPVGAASLLRSDPLSEILPTESVSESPVSSGEPSKQKAKPDFPSLSEALLSKRTPEGKLPLAEKKKKENGPVFVHLATSSDDPDVVELALDGMSRTFSAYLSESSNPVGPDFADAVLKHLGSERGQILNAALELSRTCVMGKEPQARVIQKLVEVARSHKHVDARVKALNALAAVPNFGAHADIRQAFDQALKGEPVLVSTALFRGKSAWIGSKDADKLRPVFERLLSHKDAGVRGRAIGVVASVYRNESDYVTGHGKRLLSDSSAFVRSMAVTALGSTRKRDAVALAMKLVDDSAKNTHEIEYTNLLGRSSRLHHDGSPWSRVDDAVLRSIKTATYSLGDDRRFVLGDISYKSVDADVARERERLKAWFRTFKAAANVE